MPTVLHARYAQTAAARHRRVEGNPEPVVFEKTPAEGGRQDGEAGQGCAGPGKDRGRAARRAHGKGVQQSLHKAGHDSPGARRHLFTLETPTNTVGSHPPSSPCTSTAPSTPTATCSKTPSPSSSPKSSTSLPTPPPGASRSTLHWPYPSRHPRPRGQRPPRRRRMRMR